MPAEPWPGCYHRYNRVKRRKMAFKMRSSDVKLAFKWRQMALNGVEMALPFPTPVKATVLGRVGILIATRGKRRMRRDRGGVPRRVPLPDLHRNARGPHRGKRIHATSGLGRNLIFELNDLTGAVVEAELEPPRVVHCVDLPWEGADSRVRCPYTVIDGGPASLSVCSSSRRGLGPQRGARPSYEDDTCPYMVIIDS